MFLASPSPESWGLVKGGAAEELSDEAISNIAGDLCGEEERHGMSGKVTVSAVRDLVKSSGVYIQGMLGFFKDTGTAGISDRSGAESG